MMDRKVRKAATDKAYQAAHADEIKAKKKAYQAAHADEIKAKQMAYRDAHVDEIRAKKAAKYAADPERYNEPKRKAHFDWYENNRKENCAKKGVPFVPREYVVLKTRPMTDEEYIEMYHAPRPTLKAPVIPEPEPVVQIDTKRAELLAKRKAYREANRVEILAQKKAYREANKLKRSKE